MVLRFDDPKEVRAQFAPRASAADFVKLEPLMARMRSGRLSAPPVRKSEDIPLEIEAMTA
jgi:hypothetical protein